MLHCSFVCSAAHLYALLLICMLCCSFICSATHSYAPFRFCIHSYAPPLLRVHVRLRSFVSSAAHSCSCPVFMSSVHVRMACGHMHLWVLHPHLGSSIGMKELLWFVCTPMSFCHITMHADELLWLECPCWCASDGTWERWVATINGRVSRGGHGLSQVIAGGGGQCPWWMGMVGVAVLLVHVWKYVVGVQSVQHCVLMCWHHH